MSAPGTLRALLRCREFTGLWVASTVSTAGDQFAAVALSLLVYDRTRSAGWTAATYALTMLPPLLSGPLLSWLADRYPRRTVMVSCAWLQAGLVAVMAVPDTPLPLVVCLLVAVQMVASPFLAAQEASLPAVLPPARYHDGVALFGSSADLAQMVGLASAGLIVTGLGAHTALALDAATFLLVAVLVQATVRNRPAAAPRHRRTPATPPSGPADHVTPAVVPPTELSGTGRGGALALILGDQRLRTILGLRLLAGFAMVPEGLAVPLATQLGAPWASGLLLAVEPAGNVLGVLLLYRLVRDERRRERLVGPLAVLSLLPLVGLLARPDLLGTLALLAVAALAGAYHTPVRATWGRLVPDAYRGRAHGVARTALRASQGGGVAVGGGVAQLLGSITGTIAGAGALGVLLAVRAAVSWHRAQRATAQGVTS